MNKRKKTYDGITEDMVQKLDNLNLDGANSIINKDELDNEFLEGLLISKLSFFLKLLNRHSIIRKTLFMNYKTH